MLIIGTGPTGCEIAQGFAKLGTKVTMVQRGNQFMANEDSEAIVYLQKQMENDGIDILLEAEV